MGRTGALVSLGGSPGGYDKMPLQRGRVLEASAVALRARSCAHPGSRSRPAEGSGPGSSLGLRSAPESGCPSGHGSHLSPEGRGLSWTGCRWHSRGPARPEQAPPDLALLLRPSPSHLPGEELAALPPPVHTPSGGAGEAGAAPHSPMSVSVPHPPSPTPPLFNRLRPEAAPRNQVPALKPDPG